jgi:integrase
MGIYRRKNSPSWHIRITAPSGRRIQCSAKTEDKKSAQQLHDKIKHELWETENIGKKQRRSWKEAAIRWVTEKANKKSLKKDIGTIRWLDKHFGSLYLDQITGELIKKTAKIKSEEGVEPRTINVILQLIRSILRLARDEWEWIDAIPVIKLRKQPKGRVRWITHEESMRLLAELPPHLADMVAFSLAAGLRASNVCNLQWNVIDLDRRHAYIVWDESKNENAIPVPLNDAAMEVLLRRREATGGKYVFTYEGHPVKQVSTKAWYSALKRAGIEDFRWHDLRHTWASWHVQSGTSLHELQQLGGWSCYAMVLRYAHLSSHQLTAAANRICGEKLVQKQKQ